MSKSCQNRADLVWPVSLVIIEGNRCTMTGTVNKQTEIGIFLPPVS